MRRVPRAFAGAFVVLVACLSLGAQLTHRRSPYVGAIALDADTGRRLLADQADRECYPASCTKLMTARLLLQAVKSGRLSPKDRFVQSRRSAGEQPSKIDLAVGETMSVHDALLSLMLKSANDVAVMVAEKLGGSVEGFVEMMNAEATRLGMTHTRYASPNGLPPPRGSNRGFDVSTAEDLSKLALAILREQPELLDYTRRASATVSGRNGQPLTIQNHNKLLRDKKFMVPGVDGLKTGYIDAGGSSVVATAVRDGRRALVVVTGSASQPERDREAGMLIERALGALAW